MHDTTPPTVTGPISGGERGWPFAKSLLDVSSLGYVEEEFFLAGTARSYRIVEGTDAGADGLWQAEVSGSAPYKTRVLVYRPRDAARFNGTVIVTWNNVTAGYELFSADSLELFEGGFAHVCVSAQKAGIEGLPPVHQGLADWDPGRYGTLSLPGDDYSFDVFTQAALSVGPGRSQQGVDPMGGLEVRRLVAQGASQSAARLATYFNAVQPLTRTFDGFIIAIHFGGGTSLEVGDAVVNAAAPGGGGARLSRQKTRFRDDLDVPVFVLNSELEAQACYSVRQPDTDSFRYWEAAGTSHVSAQGLSTRRRLAERDGLRTRRPHDGVNAIPMNPIYDAGYHHMQRWLTGEGPPPVQPKIEFAGEPPAVVRDAHGIAKGGIRLPQADVPLERNDAIPQQRSFPAILEGSSRPFTREQVLELHGNRESFVARFEQAAQAAVQAGVILPREVSRLVEDANARFALRLSE